jgi:hypothetical protein
MLVSGLRMLALLTISAPALAQAPSTPSNPTPPLRPLVYQSPFSDYQAYKEQPIGSWRDAIDTVGKVGGWQAYAREAQGLPPQPSAPGSVPPAAGQHGGHR